MKLVNASLPSGAAGARVRETRAREHAAVAVQAEHDTHLRRDLARTEFPGSKPLPRVAGSRGAW